MLGRQKKTEPSPARDDTVLPRTFQEGRKQFSRRRLRTPLESLGEQNPPPLPNLRYIPPVETRPVLRIFISSTAVDLRDYRDKVRDAVLRLEDLPIAMETFSQSGQPASECMKMAPKRTR